MVSKTSPQLHELEIRQHKENNNRKINGLSRYVLKYKEELKKRKASHNLCEKVIILNAAKAYRDELEIMATQISQIGQMSFQSTAQATQIILEISELHVKQILSQSNDSTIGIMNTRNIRPDFQLLEMKNLQSCNGKSVAQSIYNTFNNFNINPQRCLICISDNINYMSGKNRGAITLFNNISSAKLFRIPCGIHVAHIIMNNFEEITLEKLSNISRFSQKALPANLLYLAWELHDGYDKSWGKRWHEKLKMLSQIAMDLKTIHEVGLIYKDFHSENILQDKLFDSYISDMGLS
ncbi:15867_t:CDS:2 [Gigaspora rosea]|nr:15867_t:CDS:2 [Gigaspora rosea]